MDNRSWRKLGSLCRSTHERPSSRVSHGLTCREQPVVMGRQQAPLLCAAVMLATCFCLAPAALSSSPSTCRAEGKESSGSEGVRSPLAREVADTVSRDSDLSAMLDSNDWAGAADSSTEAPAPAASPAGVPRPASRTAAPSPPSPPPPPPPTPPANFPVPREWEPTAGATSMLIPVPAHSANIVARFLHRHPGRQALLRGCAMVRHEWLAAVSSSHPTAEDD